MGSMKDKYKTKFEEEFFSMKTVKKALLATSLAGALVVSAGYGTYSWFTSSTSAMGTIDTGNYRLITGKQSRHRYLRQQSLLHPKWLWETLLPLIIQGI